MKNVFTRIKSAFLAISILAIFLLLAFGCHCKMNVEKFNAISIIPKPAEMKVGSGEFVISTETKIWTDSADGEIQGVADYLTNMLNKACGFHFAAELYPGTRPEKGTGYILLSTRGANSSLGDKATNCW